MKYLTNRFRANPTNTPYPIIGILDIPYSQAYVGECRRKLESVSINGISPHVVAMNYTSIALFQEDMGKSVAELEPKYRERFETLADDYLKNLDGLMLPGDRFDVDPLLYNQEKHSETAIEEDPRRGLFIRALLRRSKEFMVPGLGICGSTQQYVVLEGGKLVQHVPDATDKTIDHRRRDLRHEVIHTVTTEYPKEGSHYYRLMQTREERGNDKHCKKPVTRWVNSIHHQAADISHVPDSFILMATAPDGTVEALESRHYPWILVQYHPELLKRLDLQGNRTLENGDFQKTRDGDYLNGQKLPIDEDYYASERLIEDLVGKAITHRQKRQVNLDITSKEPQPDWVASLTTPLAKAISKVCVGFER